MMISRKSMSCLAPTLGSLWLMAMWSELASPIRLSAQPLTVLHSFGPTLSTTNAVPYNADGVRPLGSLIASGNTLYGTTVSGGRSGLGTVFKINVDGSGFTLLHNFLANEGWNPNAALVLSNDTLYGTAQGGGDWGYGTVFAVKTDGTDYRQLYSFSGIEGGYPYCDLVLAGTTLYGTTVSGGNAQAGTVFAIGLDNGGFTNLYSFSLYDGSAPFGGLALSNNVLFGATVGGGDWDGGTLFSVHTDGTHFKTLYSFTGGDDGANPYAKLTLSNSVIYGVALGGTASNNGTIFRLYTDGSGFTTLHKFGTDTDGAKSGATLWLSGGTLYGAAQSGGNSTVGRVFAISTDGTDFTNVYSFAGGRDGAYPEGGVILVGNSLYGTTMAGGDSGNGTVFRLSLQPVAATSALATALSGTNLSISWNAGPTGLALEWTTNLASPVVWTPVVQTPVVVNGQTSVSLPLAGPQRFYRLHP